MNDIVECGWCNVDIVQCRCLWRQEWRELLVEHKKQWVCHISGQGEKWEVLSEESRHWRTKDGDIFMWLPKSEYRLCDPPEVWRDVTNECKLSPLAGSELSHDSMKVFLPMGYRLRKVHLWTQDDERQWAFIVEKKVS